MGSLVNSTKHLRNKFYKLSIIFFRKEKQREYFLRPALS